MLTIAAAIISTKQRSFSFLLPVVIFRPGRIAQRSGKRPENLDTSDREHIEKPAEEITQYNRKRSK